MSGERYDLKNIDEAFKLVSDKNLEEVYKKFCLDFGYSSPFKGIYTSIKSIRESIVEIIIGRINEQYREDKGRISELRKKGFDVGVLDYDFLRIPLKIKMMKANFNLESYDKILQIFYSSEEQLKILVDELERAEKEK